MLERAAIVRWGRRRGWVFVVAGLLALAWMTFPPLPRGDELGAYEADPSLSLILGCARERGLQFGSDLVYTYGPLGFLVFPHFGAAGAGLRLVLDAGLSGLAALGLCLVAARAGAWRGWLLVLIFAWAAAQAEIRTDLVLNTALLSWGWLSLTETGRRLTGSVAVLVGIAAFCAAAKVSFLLTAPAATALVAADLWIRGERRLAGGALAGWGLGFFALWVLAGQSPAGLGEFLLRAPEVARGYNAALGWEPLWLPGRLAWAAVALLGLSGVGWTFAPDGADWRRRRRWLRLGWLGVIVFPAWKHAIVRAHESNLVSWFAFTVAVLLLLNASCANPRPRTNWRIWLPSAGCLLLSLAGLQCFLPPLGKSWVRPFQAAAGNLQILANPGDYLRRAHTQLEVNRENARLPRLREIVGEEAVDVFGRRQAFALLNGWNYRPRPAPQGYAVSNARLMRLNEEFYRSARAPRWVLFELDALDRKLPPLEDALVLRHLLINYEPAARERGFLLLERRTAEKPALTLLREGAIGLGQPIDLRALAGKDLWLEVDIHPSWAGWLRQFLARAPVLRLAAWREPGGDLWVRKRAPASMLAGGFLLSPLLLRTEDVAQLYASASPRQPGACALEAAPGEDYLWSRELRYRVFEVANRLGRSDPHGVGQEWDRAATEAASGGKPRGQTTAAAAATTAPAAPPFVVFRSPRWRPDLPAPGGLDEWLTFALFAALPLVAGGMLWSFARAGRHRSRPAGWLRLLVGNALVLLGLLSAAFLAGECYFRFFYDTTDSLAFTKVCQRWVQRHWRVNGAGCRDEVEYAAARTPGKRRVVFLGDSFTAGHGIKEVRDRFANRLRQRHPDWEVQVLANVGLDTGAEMILLRRLFAKGWEPGEVVLVYCLNDLGDLMTEAGQEVGSRLDNPEAHGWWVRNSYLVNLLFHHYQASRQPEARDYFPRVRAAYQGPLWEKQKERLKALRDLVASHGGRFSAVTFPFLHALGPRYEYQFVHDQLGQLWAELAVPHLDLLPVFAGWDPAEVTVNAYDAHPNERANQLAAEAIDAWLAR